jgi:hypothetical protein
MTPKNTSRFAKSSTNRDHLQCLIQTTAVLSAGVLCLLLAGCGLTLNPVRSAGVQSVTVPTPGGTKVSLPAEFRALTGCANPNTGITDGNWGVSSDPVYAAVNNVSPIVGTPVYTSNSVFWTSRENGPGQSILLAGAFTDANKTARLAFLPPGTANWQALVKQSSIVVSTTQQGTTGLSFIVPPDFPKGVYGFEIDDPSSPPILGLANRPAMNWAIGVPPVTDPDVALQHQVYDCGVEQGGVLRIFGKNFASGHNVVLQSSSGIAYSFAPSKLDSNSISVSVPKTLSPGKYNVWVGGEPWSVTASPASEITVTAPPNFIHQDASCPELVGDGVTDNTKRLQSCLDLYAPIPGATNFVVYIHVPAGNFVLTSGVKAHPFEVLLGADSTTTVFIGKPKGAAPSAWFNVPRNFGMANLSLRAPANPDLLLSDGTLTGDPAASGHLFFSHIDFASTADIQNGAENMFAVAGPDIQIYDSSFLSGSNQVFDIFFGDGGIVSGNQFVLNNWTGLGITDSQNQIFENNLTTSDVQPVQTDSGNNSGSGLSVSRGNSLSGQSALSRNIYIGYNTFQHMGSNGQQVITNDGDGGAYIGPVASSTVDTVTLAADPAWNWMGTTNPEAAVLAIAFGKGVGQYSFLKSYSGRTIHLETPLQVLPDETSVVVITQYEQNMTIAHNTITNTLGGSIVLGDALEGVVEDNVLTNSGMGILISAFGPYGGPAAFGPVMNTDVLRNTLSVGEGDMIAYDHGLFIWGIGIQDFPGCLLSGLMVRDNRVPSMQVIYNTDGVNGITANVIEQNEANWEPTFPTPGFLVQDNTPPPP